MKKQAKRKMNFTILVVLNCWRVVVVASMFIGWSVATAPYLMMYVSKSKSDSVFIRTSHRKFCT
jgi:hypothetical protein